MCVNSVKVPKYLVRKHAQQLFDTEVKHSNSVAATHLFPKSSAPIQEEKDLGF